MTKEPDALDTLGLHQSERENPPRRPWWVATQSLQAAIVLECVWAVMLALRIVQAIQAKTVDPVEWILLIVYALLTVGYVPSLVRSARLRNHASPSATTTPD